jgi:hypothetical protein
MHVVISLMGCIIFLSQSTSGFTSVLVDNQPLANDLQLLRLSYSIAHSLRLAVGSYSGADQFLYFTARQCYLPCSQLDFVLSLLNPVPIFVAHISEMHTV